MPTHDYEAIGRAVVLIASLFAGSEFVEAPTKVAPKETKAKDTKPADPTPPTDTGSASTPDQAKDDGAADGNSQGLDGAAFAKLVVAFASEMKDNGAKAKEIMTEFIEDKSQPPRAGMIKASDYDAVLAKMEEAKLA